MTAPRGLGPLADAITDQGSLDLLLQTGTVLAVNGDGTLSVDLAGAELTLPKLNSYSAAVSDVVTVVNASGKRLVMGRAGVYVGGGGAQGPAGPAGPQGEPGPQGPAGPAGADGTPFGTSVSVQTSVPAYVEHSSDTFAALTGDPAVVFVAPPTGKVLVHIKMALLGTTAGTTASAAFELRTGSTVGSGTVVHAATDDDGVSSPSGGTISAEAGATTLIGGLTGGTTYHVRAMYRRQAGTGAAGYSRRRILVSPTV